MKKNLELVNKETIAMDLFESFLANKNNPELKKYESMWANLQFNLLNETTYDLYNKCYRFTSLKAKNFYENYSNYLKEKSSYNNEEKDTIKYTLYNMSSYSSVWKENDVVLFFTYLIKSKVDEYGLNVNVKYNGLPSKFKNEDFYYSKDNNTIYINSERIAASLEKDTTVVGVIYKTIKTLENLRSIKILKNEITPQTLQYMQEHIFLNTFGKLITRKVLETPLMEIDTYKRMDQTLKDLFIGSNYGLSASMKKDFEILTGLDDYKSLLNKKHYASENEEYAEKFISTMAGKAIRGRPNSCPSMIKNYVFLNAQLKTIIQLEDQLEIFKENYIPKSISPYFGPFKKAYYDRIAINDCLFKNNNVLRIQTLFRNLKNATEENYQEILEQLHQAQIHTRDDYDLAIILLRDRLHELNTYCASNSTNAYRYKKELDATIDLLNVATECTVIKSNVEDLKYSLKANKFNAYNDKNIRYYQSLTGLGFGSAQEKIQKSLNSNSECILHNLTPELATIITNKLAGKLSTNQIEIIPPIKKGETITK
ncbi:MAG: hypothetical protein E7184_01670 [Erysipelotrichaceae bacterium]|nr:hypothetical protein [Erysipelotrichaceae bacterium]